MCVSKRVVIFIFLTISSWQTLARDNVSWPVGMSFVGLTEDSWQLYIVKTNSAKPEVVSLSSEPRTPAYSPTLELIAYVSSQGDVMQYDLATGQEVILLKQQASLAYTQPVYSPERKSLVVVALQQSRSQSTHIIEVDLQTGKVITLSQQRSAQFEPVVFGQNVYYTNVHCIENCAGRYIHEIWVKNLASKDAQQLTMLNSLSHQPVISRDGRFLYLSSEKTNGKRIWKCELNGLPPIPCTMINSSSVADTSPAVAKDGTLYFTRLHADGSRVILRLGNEGKKGSEPETLPLPKEITEIRDMKIGQ